MCLITIIFEAKINFLEGPDIITEFAIHIQYRQWNGIQIQIQKLNMQK
jgi:hypothetical protein